MITIDDGEKWSRRKDVFAGAKGFVEGGGKLVRLEFPQTEIQVYYGHLASGHIAQTFRALPGVDILPGVGLDKAARIKGDTVIRMPNRRTA